MDLVNEGSGMAGLSILCMEQTSEPWAKIAIFITRRVLLDTAFLRIWGRGENHG